jgi:hypothetical protein
MDEDYLAQIIAEQKRREYMRQLGLMQQKGSNAPNAPLPRDFSMPAPVGNALALGPGKPGGYSFGAVRLNQMADGRILDDDVIQRGPIHIGGDVPDHTFGGVRDRRETIQERIARNREWMKKR